MKIIINTSNLYVGGGLQVALSFLNELKQMKQKHEYHVFLSQAVAKQIDQSSFPGNFTFYLIEKSPSSLKSRRRIVSRLDALEEEIKPDIVFSVFAPTYWRPKTTHIVGFALGWLTNPRSEAYETLGIKQKIKRNLDSLYKKFYVRRDADFYIVETDDVRDKMNSVLNIPKQDIFVVGNTYSEYFDRDDFPTFELAEKRSNEFRLITIAHNYPHKNILVIKEVLPYLKNEKFHYAFFVTIDDKSYREHFEGMEEQVINLGPVPSKYCPSLYQQCDALFLPTLLESFTASYPEAMKMKKPILTSDLSFAHSICGVAALYFDPLDPKDIANKIIRLSEDKKLQSKLIDKGVERLESFETAKSRAQKYIEICESIVKKEGK